MEPIFTEDQLKNMSREALIELMQVMQEQQRKAETKLKLMEEKQKELEFLNAMLSDRLTLAKYAPSFPADFHIIRFPL